jgi:hypothetical protein
MPGGRIGGTLQHPLAGYIIIVVREFFYLDNVKGECAHSCFIGIVALVIGECFLPAPGYAVAPDELERIVVPIRLHEGF